MSQPRSRSGRPVHAGKVTRRIDTRAILARHDRLSCAVRWRRPSVSNAAHQAASSKKAVWGATSAWQKRWTPDGSVCFYYNARTRAVSWDRPKEYSTNHDEAVSRNRCAEFKHSTSWVRAWTDDGLPFYHNVRTNEVVWDRPPEFCQPEETEQGLCAAQFEVRLVYNVLLACFYMI